MNRTGPPNPQAAEPRREHGPDAFPDWVHRLGVAVWISDHEQRLRWLNPRAERILGRTSDDCAGRSCFQVICGQDSAGQAFCERNCSPVTLAMSDQVLEPIRIGVQRGGQETEWLQVMIIPIRGPDDSWPWLVHCAEPVNRSHRMERYLEQVAARNQRACGPEISARWCQLTARQIEVLELLARDLDLDETAARLGIRRVTVRNHVQHILSKLGVHSIQEAVAQYLVENLRPRE